MTDPGPAGAPDPTGRLDNAALADALVAGAAGWLPAQAAVGLVVAHRYWLGRPELRACVELGAGHHSGRLLAHLDWEGLLAAGPAGSASETTILCLAAELAGVDTATPLAHLVSGLDTTNLARLHHAIAVCAGHA